MLITVEDISLYCRQCTAEPTIGERCIEESEFSDVIPQIGVRLFRQLEGYEDDLRHIDLYIAEHEKLKHEYEVQLLQIEDKYAHDKLTEDEYIAQHQQTQESINIENMQIANYQQEKDSLKDSDIEMLLEGGYYVPSGSTEVEELQVIGLKKIEAYYAAARIVRSGNDVMTRYGLVNKDDQDSTPASDKRIANLGAYLKGYADEMMANLKEYLKVIDAEQNNVSVGTKAPTLTIYAIGAE